MFLGGGFGGSASKWGSLGVILRGLSSGIIGGGVGVD